MGRGIPLPNPIGVDGVDDRSWRAVGFLVFLVAIAARVASGACTVPRSGWAPGNLDAVLDALQARVGRGLVGGGGDFGLETGAREV